MRKTKYAIGEYYHIYNRGVEKRNIFTSPEEVVRFLESMNELNTLAPLGGIKQIKFFKKSVPEVVFASAKNKKLVHIVAYCLNQNHFHFILTPLIDQGIQKFMHRLSTGYTMYFNTKHARTGVLFSGRYKSIHIGRTRYLNHLSVYVNYNSDLHGSLNKPWMKKMSISSKDTYLYGTPNPLVAGTTAILGQFSSHEKYRAYATSALKDIEKKKSIDRELTLRLLD